MRNATDTERVVPSAGAAYYVDRYWNEVPAVVFYMQQRATGDPDLNWCAHLHQWRGRPFRKALVLNCGNGWVERHLVEWGYASEAVGVDVSEELLAEARARATGLAIRHYCIDTNTGELPEEGYDLVVNHAALHHIAYIDRVVRAVAALLPDDGVLVSWDYVGPHRNQYPGEMWEAAHQVNQRLPEAVRSAMDYPSFGPMVTVDPTEAVHSELVLPVMRRYFHLVHERTLGGGIGYLLLTHNGVLIDAAPPVRDPAVATILEADAEFTDADPHHTLFAYVIAVPNKAVLQDLVQLEAWTAEESERERAAAANGGRYYPPTVVEALIERESQAPRLLPGPAVAYRQALAATLRAVGRVVSPSVRSRVKELPGVATGWRKLLGARNR
jgi:SAM-dependent methyltransferase